MATVGHECVHRVVCGVHVSSSIRWAQKMHFCGMSSSSFHQMAP